MVFARRPDGMTRWAFTLVEVAASVAIVGIVVTGLLLARVRAQRAFGVARTVTICSELCASRISALRAGLAGEGAGEFVNPEGYTWQIVERAMDESAPEGVRGFEVHVMPPSGAEGAAATIWLDGGVSGGDGRP